MGILTRLLGAPVRAETSGPSSAPSWLLETLGAQPSAAGVTVNADKALTISAVYAAVSILAQTVASLPLILYRRLERGKERARNHPLYDLLHDRPNPWQTAFEFREMMTGHVLLRGNAYAQIVPGQRGFADQLVPLHPGRMVVERLENGRLRYRYTRQDGRTQVFTQEEVFHLRGLSSDGIVGVSVVSLARESLGLAIATEQYGARFFSQHARPGGVLEHPGKLSDAAAERLRQSWQQLHAGLEQAHKVAILEEGMKWHQIGLSNEDAQFLATREFSIHEVARWFNMPVHMLRAETKTASYASIEMFSLEYMLYTLRPWLVRWEQAISRDLILAPDTYFAEHLVEGLLRGNIRDRYEAYRVAITTGWMSRNEARERENLNPADGLDDFLVPTNMAAVGEDGEPRPLNEPQQAALGAPPAVEPAPATVEARARALAEEVAGIVVRREMAAVAKAARRFADDPEGWERWVREFYAQHATAVARNLRISEEAARRYAEEQRDAVLWGGVAAMDTWLEERVPELVRLALKGGT